MSEEIRKIVPPEFYTLHLTNFGNCVRKALALRQWKEWDGLGGWNLQWVDKERINDVFEEGITPSQRVNHFRLYTQVYFFKIKLCKKDMLMKNVRRYKRELAKKKQVIESEWDFLPNTFFLPSEYVMFLEDWKKKGGLWIMKPTGRCQGSGIFLVNKLAQVMPYRTKPNPQIQEAQPEPQVQKTQLRKKQEKEDSSDQGSVSSNDSDTNKGEKEEEEKEENPMETFIIQKYIDNPLLFGNKKFDMRIYVLCTDYHSLTVWLYRSGFARFTHEPYNPDDIENLGGHLTNVEIQKHCENYDPIRGGKWLLHEFKHYLFSRYDRKLVNKCFTGIKEIILKSLLSVQSRILPSKSSYELYGYDFMMDSNLRPWLIEVNGGPSMSANTDFDCKLKCGLIDDVLSILDLEGILTGQEMTVGGFDLIMRNNIPVVEDPASEVGCLLGAKNERVKVMKYLGYEFMKRKTFQEKEKAVESLREEEKKRKKQEEQMVDKSKKKDKLLPSFYYEKTRDINDNIVSELKEELEFLDIEMERHFVPLQAITNNNSQNVINGNGGYFVQTVQV